MELCGQCLSPLSPGICVRCGAQTPFQAQCSQTCCRTSHRFLFDKFLKLKSLSILLKDFFSFARRSSGLQPYLSTEHFSFKPTKPGWVADSFGRRDISFNHFCLPKVFTFACCNNCLKGCKTIQVHYFYPILP